MKLDVKKSDFDTAELGDKSFSIGDTSIIFEVLRSKMYSNPIDSVCREVSCNARDAMREAGRGDIPISIFVPNNEEPFFKVKDTGVGISPERIEDIYIKYGSSTKRTDNVQTGGFGLGSKVPFAYTDTFNIITVYNGIIYNYVCYIDDTNVGKIGLLSQEATTKRNGTEVIIPVKSMDFRNFASGTVKACTNWQVRPDTNVQIFTDPNIIISNDKWNLVASTFSSTEILIDGISYPIDTVNLDYNYSIMNNVQGTLQLIFNIGELTLSANRERIYFDDKTKKTLIDRLTAAEMEMQNRMIDFISEEPTYVSACMLYNKYYNTIFKFLPKNVDWHGNLLLHQAEYFRCARVFHKEVSMSTRAVNSIKLDHEAIIAINDTNRQNITRAHANTIFKNNDRINTIYIINQTDYIESKFPMHMLNTLKLSSIVPSARVAKTYKLLKLNHITCKFDKCSNRSIKNDKGVKYIVKLNSNKSMNISGCNISCNTISMLLNENISVYGTFEDIDSSIVKEALGDAIPIIEWIKEEISKHNVKLYTVMSVHRKYSYPDDIVDKIKDENSLYRKYLLSCKLLSGFTDLMRVILYLHDQFLGAISEEDIQAYIKNKQEYNASLLLDLCYNAYPIIKYVDINCWSDSARVDSVVEYINMVDSYLKLTTPCE